MTQHERFTDAQFDEALAGAILKEQMLRFHAAPWCPETASRLAQAARVYAALVERVHCEHTGSGPCFIPSLGGVVN